MKNKIKAIIIDDERLARKELRNLLTSFKQIEVIDECENAMEAMDKIESLKPDLLFLDIQMPEKDGFELLEELSVVPKVIFITAYDEYAIKAFEFHAFDYLLKPVAEDRLRETIQTLSEEFSTDSAEDEKTLTANDRVFVKDGDKCWFVRLEDVALFESEGNYVRVYFEGNKPLILNSLNNLEKKLNNRIFFRANRKHIINLNGVVKIENWFNGGLMVTLENDLKIEISRRQSSKLKEMMAL